MAVLRAAVRLVAKAMRWSAGGLARQLRALTDSATWLATADLVVSLALGAAFTAVIAVALFAAFATAGIVGLGSLVRAGALRLSARMGAVDRRRLGRLGVELRPLPLPQPEPGASFRQRQLAWGRASWLWRLPAYQAVRLPLAGVLAFAAVTWWWSAIACFVLAASPRTPVLLLGWHAGPVNPAAPAATVLVLVGLGCILAWPALVRAAIEAEALAARELLGPGRSGLLAAEVSRLGEARTLAVESAEAERRRIERDLHDGLQPQLVALALDLGLVRARLERDPDEARSLVERAHEEAKRASSDLRNLVRGIHPSVLDERGLDAALSALVAGCAVPVAVEVRLGERRDLTRESIAYFVVAEAITNVGKHADARAASVTIDGEPDALRVVVEDDGKGGARLEPGGGLTGLAARVASVDGTFTLASQPGGPTRIEAVIPCAP